MIQDAAGNLYGTASGGGATSTCEPPYGCGVVFKLSPSGAYTILHSFTGADGAYPEAGLVRDAAANLYGTTARGGAYNSTCDPPYGCGVVFKLTLTGTETVLHSFAGADGGPFPSGLIQDAEGNLYGTTLEGGEPGNCFSGSCGVVFKVSPSGTETVLYSFTEGAGGANPYAGLTRDAAGNLYGTTYDGGAKSGACEQPTCGVVFRLSPTGTETVLHTFTGGTDGGTPYAGLIQTRQATCTVPPLTAALTATAWCSG